MNDRLKVTGVGYLRIRIFMCKQGQLIYVEKKDTKLCERLCVFYGHCVFLLSFFSMRGSCMILSFESSYLFRFFSLSLCMDVRCIILARVRRPHGSILLEANV